MYVTAIRETFEECGVLASTCGHPHLTLNEFQRGRLRVYEDAAQFQTLMSAWHVELDFGSLYPWGRFCAPKSAKRRFDTMFYMRIVSLRHVDQFRVHDDHEIAGTAWYSPNEALVQYRNGKIQLAPPQWYVLNELQQHFRTIQDLHHAAQNRPYPLLYEPVPLSTHDDSTAFALPGDEAHETYRGCIGDLHRMTVLEALSPTPVVTELKRTIAFDPAMHFPSTPDPTL